MNKKDTLFTGLMLFSMFFGAGNLIFPPFLGVESGTSYWLAIAGFIVTGVGLPFAVLAAISLVEGGIQTIGNRVHPLFSIVFMVIIYLCIGPFLAIPRNANVAYNMGIKPFLTTGSALYLFLFTFIFFTLTYTVSLNPSKMEKYLGKWITPILLLSMIILCITGFTQLDAPFQTPVADYQSGAFFKGFINGYNTMDALASLAFGIVILTAIQKKGVSSRKHLTIYTMKAAIIAGVSLALVYISLGFIGARMAGTGDYQNGTDILTSAATLLLGGGGKILLGFIFTLACFTTVVGLTTACGQYFSSLLPKINYRFIVLLITLVSFTLSNLGLNQILKVSVPFLEMAYPMTIVLIILSFFHRFFKGSRMIYGCALLFTGLITVINGLHSLGINMGALETFIQTLPFAKMGFGWIIPSLSGILIGIIFTMAKRTQNIEKNINVK